MRRLLSGEGYVFTKQTRMYVRTCALFSYIRITVQHSREFGFPYFASKCAPFALWDADFGDGILQLRRGSTIAS